jgi:hypothetical protein
MGIVAVRLMDVEPETERWRGIARDWYDAGLAEQPGTGPFDFLPFSGS